MGKRFHQSKLDGVLVTNAQRQGIGFAFLNNRLPAFRLASCCISPSPSFGVAVQ